DEFLTPDESTVYFSSNRLGAESLFMASKSGGSTFGEPTLISELVAPSAANDISPVVTADQLTIFFASNRSGNSDIWMATRSSATAPFGAPVEVSVLNIGDVDYPLWLSPDE